MDKNVDFEQSLAQLEKTVSLLESVSNGISELKYELGLH